VRPVNDNAVEFLEIVEDFADLTGKVTAERALAEFDETTLQVFWQKWPQVSAWAGWLWSRLSAELASAAQQADPDTDEIGESG
jgi:hypothetical protein